jgi:hypothetical protein
MTSRALYAGRPRLLPLTGRISVMPSEKITRALSRRLSQSKGKPVTAAIYAGIESDKLTLSSFAARTAQRNQMMRDRFSQIMERIQTWEQSSGETASITFRPEEDAIVVSAAPALFEELAEESAVVAIDVAKA